MIKLIAMDMDGTLLNSKHQISAENLKAIEEAHAAGVHLAICSGRTPEDISFYASDAGLFYMHMLALNGGCCLDKPHGQVVFNRGMEPPVAQKLAALLDQSGLEYTIFYGDDIWINRDTADSQDWRRLCDHLEGESEIHAVIGPKERQRLIGSGPHKMVCFDEVASQRLERLRQTIQARLLGVQVTSSWPDNLEIMPYGVDKGLAITQLAGRLGLTMDEVMALGDNDNDLPMLSAAGVSVCMANGTPKAKAAAKFETGSCDQSGVAQAIRKFVLHGGG